MIEVAALNTRQLMAETDVACREAEQAYETTVRQSMNHVAETIVEGGGFTTNVSAFVFAMCGVRYDPNGMDKRKEQGGDPLELKFDALLGSVQGISSQVMAHDTGHDPTSVRDYLYMQPRVKPVIPDEDPWVKKPLHFFIDREKIFNRKAYVGRPILPVLITGTPRAVTSDEMDLSVSRTALKLGRIRRKEIKNTPEDEGLVIASNWRDIWHIGKSEVAASAIVHYGTDLETDTAFLRYLDVGTKALWAAEKTTVLDPSKLK